VDLPRLAVVYDSGSAPLIDIAKAATGICRPIFVVDMGSPTGTGMMKMLKHLGTVCDVTGLGFAGTAALVASHHPAGVITFSDTRLEFTAALSAALGLGGHSPEVVRLVTSKDLQRRALRVGGLPTPETRQVVSVRNLLEVTAHAREPFVIKPVRGAGSVDTFLIDGVVPDHVRDAVARRTLAGDVFVAEELLVGDPSVAGRDYGDYVSVESLVGSTGPVHFAVTGKFPLAPPFRETGMFYPSSLDSVTMKAVVDCADQALHALGIEFGACHTEIKLTAEGPRIIEVNARLGGYVSAVIEQAGATSLLAATLRQAIYPEWSVLPAVATRVGFQLFVVPPPGVTCLRAVHGLEDLRALPGVDGVTVLRRRGERVNWLDGTEGMVARVTGHAEDHGTLRQLASAVRETLIIEYS
jgi:biotin carboxylase